MSETKKATQYSAKFRESAVKLAVEGDQPISQTAEDLGINKNTLHTWISKLHKGSQPKAKQVNDEHIHDELKRLRKDVKRLTEERDILKKAAAYFAKESL